MKIVQLTPGAGGMYCGNCFRDNAMVAELRRQGHDTLMLPLYLPMTLDESDQSAGTPIFFGGINVYLEQKLSWFRGAPDWLRHWLNSSPLLKFAAGKAAKTRASDLGDLTWSMLRGEEGNQARELEELVTWLREHIQPDVICLSNALLLGMARRLKSDLKTKVVCLLQGEDEFLDGLPDPYKQKCWELLSERAQELDGFIAPSRYFGDLMARRLKLPPARVHVVPNGIHLQGYPTHYHPPSAPQPTLGYFARMCREKGLDRLVDAFLIARERVPHLQLRIGGACGPADEKFVAALKVKLSDASALSQVSFHPNLTREEKIEFLRSITLFSVPAAYSEAFGLYVIEAMAAGVPVVQPRHAAFPEIIEISHGGVLSEPNPKSLAEQIVALCESPERMTQLGKQAHLAIREHYSVETMTRKTVEVFQSLT